MNGSRTSKGNAMNEINEIVARRITSPGPKKILSCDGGGILGLMSVEILARLEADLRRETANPQLLLCDYFDFVCGTSTGAIIAACIAAVMLIIIVTVSVIDLISARIRQLML